MKVLIIHQHFNTPATGGPLRSYYLARALVDAGIAVAVVTATTNPPVSHEIYEGIDVHYLPIAYENRFGFYKRGISFIRFAVDAVKVARQIPDISVCYAISVPLTVGQSAIWIQRALGTPFYFEVGDLWPEAPIQLGFIKNPFLRESLYWLERRIYARAKGVVALSEPIRQSIARKAGNTPIVVIPNMADTGFYQMKPKDRNLEARYGTAGNFVVSYIGAIGFANGLDHYLECARACKQQGLPVKFMLCGEGALTNHFHSVKKRLSLDNLEILPFQDREGVRAVMSVSDATFISYRPEPILETGSPHKYFDGLACGNLIIVNFGGWIKEEIEREECGFAVEGRNPAGFATSIRRFLDRPDELQRFRANARRLAETKYSRELLTKKFVALFR